LTKKQFFSPNLSSNSENICWIILITHNANKKHKNVSRLTSGVQKNTHVSKKEIAPTKQQLEIDIYFCHYSLDNN